MHISCRYCLQGTGEPLDCPTISECDAGTVVPLHINAIVYLLVVVAVVGIIGLLVPLFLWNRRTGTLRDEQTASSLHRLISFLSSPASQTAIPLDGFEYKPRPISLQFNALGLKLRGSNKVVLEGVTGQFEHSSLIAIMGPSGAGKTTFLNTLCGKAFYGTTTGELLINDEPGSVSSEKFQREVHARTYKRTRICACARMHTHTHTRTLAGLLAPVLTHRRTNAHCLAHPLAQFAPSPTRPHTCSLASSHAHTHSCIHACLLACMHARAS